ncbi:two-component sensor histidine kinase [Sphaerisporangium krabiense]|uniref:histidine kinase n=1 Tax=Sphaerisporangium krabiense TaxID=763782 RepID=A0A7W9DS77_9ACTN|nr:sensor histidine kinase [Sphaerisporangium krabiense]MBB5628899.1 signal transduction histidine kinase [Sphaerisporangium krabiense]GII60258.1 two-component sensor histidine kinase [Sphaerisporangium krabiense]
MTHLRRLADLWRRCDVVVRDLPLVLLLAVASLLPALHGKGTQVGDLPARPFDAPALVLIALECLPLAVRRRWPAASLALVSLGFALDQLSAYHVFASNAMPIALISAGAHLERHRRVTVVVLSLAYVPLALAVGRLGATERPEGYVVFYLALALAWGTGAWLRSTRAAEAERRRHVAEATRTAERTRIARELHDVVTHHVTAMVVQAEAARYLTAAPDRFDAALSNVADTGRRAITDLRHMLDLLKAPHDTDVGMPSAGGLHTLVERTRQAGQPVDFSEEGTPAESAGSAEFVTYRVVQEALTNALKHARGSPTVVSVRYGEKEISVEVGTGPGIGPGAASPGGSGRGLAGLRERVEALGGEFSADRGPGGGFLVRARIPAGSPS